MQGYRIYIFPIIILISSVLCAQSYLEPQMISVDNGITGQYINCIAIDKKGFLWVGTNTGLDRYDGYTFKHFLTGQNALQSETEQSVTAIKTDVEGNLWVISEDALNRIDQKTGEIALYSSGSFDTLFARSSELINIFPDSDGTIWILTDQTLTKLIPGQTAKSFLLPSEQSNQENVPTSIAADDRGNIWIGTTTGPIIFNKENHHFTKLLYGNSEGILSNRDVTCLFMDKDHTMWVGTKNGLNRFDPVDFDFESFYPVKSKKAQPANEIYSIIQGNNGKLIITTGEGIISFSGNGQKFDVIYSEKEYSLSSAILDFSGNIWGCTSQGILKLRRNTVKVTNLTTTTAGGKLSENSITAMGLSANGDLWVGHPNQGIDIVNKKGNKVTHLRNPEMGTINAIMQIQNNKMAVTGDSGISFFNATTFDAEDFYKQYPYAKKNLLRHIRLNCMQKDSSGKLWIGTSRGLQMIDPDSSKHVLIKILRAGKDSIQLKQVYDIEKDSDNNLWLGTDKGLIFFSPSKKRIYKYTPYDKLMLNTEQKKVFTIVPESRDVFLIGTSRGGYIFNIERHDFSAISNDKSIMNLAVHAVAVDNLHHIWVGSDKGLFYSVQDKLYFFDTGDGFVNSAYSFACSGDGDRVYLGGNRGLSIIDADSVSVQESQINPTITFTSFSLIGNEPVKELYSTLPDTIVLSWKNNAVRIDFALLDFTQPQNNLYKYSFEKVGRSLTWYLIGSQNYVLLNHLAPGKYVFRVNGTGNSSLNWNSTPATVMIIVEAPIWKSKAAIIIYIAIFLLILLTLFRLWTSQLINLNREYKEREKIAKQIMLQKEELSLKNKSITDSINYARRIQTAMLPPQKLFKSIFPESFILYLPKDIVSGDFYWVNKLNNKIFISAVDCTGHGVPGAFMSIIGFELFRKITAIEGLSRPSDILNRLNEDFHEIFKDVDNVVLRDGMDVAFCSIDKNDMILEFSGAFSPLYLIRDDKITEIKGDRFAIGIDETNFKDQTFKNHLIPLQDGDIIYIFSDGFADQFGGPEGKKYKYRRFRHLLLNLHQFSMDKQREILENSVVEWRGDQEQIDDILVIGIKIKF